MAQKQTKLISRHTNTCSKNSFRENKVSYVLDLRKLKNTYILGMTGRSKRAEVWDGYNRDTSFTCMKLLKNKQDFFKQKEKVNE